MKQKFGKLKFVHVTKDMPPYMAHFDSDFDAIVEGTYSQIYGGKDTQSYCLHKINNNKVVKTISWYKEDQLEFTPMQDMEKAEQMIEDYHLSR